ncbi:MAG: hypothetical protein QXO02_09020, partial [Thermofilaceae archaeon]
ARSRATVTTTYLANCYHPYSQREKAARADALTAITILPHGAYRKAEGTDHSPSFQLLSHEP